MGKIINITDKIKENQRKEEVEKVRKRLYELASTVDGAKMNDIVDINGEDVLFIMDSVSNPIDIEMIARFIVDNAGFYGDVSRFVYQRMTGAMDKASAMLKFLIIQYIKECVKNNSKILFGAIELNKDINTFTQKELDDVAYEGINFISKYLDELYDKEGDLNNE